MYEKLQPTHEKWKNGGMNGEATGDDGLRDYTMSNKRR
jgi:hypothetical protein